MRGTTDLEEKQQESDEETCRPVAPREDLRTRIQPKSEQTNPTKSNDKQQPKETPRQDRPQVQPASQEDGLWWPARAW